MPIERKPLPTDHPAVRGHRIRLNCIAPMYLVREEGDELWTFERTCSH